MAGPGLRVDNDTQYPDDGSDASVHLHQTDHDAIHGIVNHIDKDTPPAGNGQVWVSISGVMTPRALTAADVGAATGLTNAADARELLENDDLAEEQRIKRARLAIYARSGVLNTIASTAATTSS